MPLINKMAMIIQIYGIFGNMSQQTLIYVT